MYVFKYKRLGKLFSKSIKVIGHSHLVEQDKMILYKEDGSVEEIADWNNCAVSLGMDWVIETKKTMENQAGTTLPLNIK